MCAKVLKNKKNNAYTLCLPYDLTTLPEGLRAYTMKNVDSEGNLVFNEVESIEANMPYLITTLANAEH